MHRLISLLYLIYQNSKPQERIPVGCVLLKLFTIQGRGSLSGRPHGQRLSGQRPLGQRHPLERDTLWKETPWPETPLGRDPQTETSWTETPWIETLWTGVPWTETTTGKRPPDRTPQQRPTRRNMGPSSQVRSDIIQRPPSPVDRMTDTHL